LDLLLELGDLPPGWRQADEKLYRVGFGGGKRGKRARQQKFVGATRLFVQPQARLNVLSVATPTASEEDALAQLAEGKALRLGSFQWQGKTRDVTEVPPPSEAGEHARALVTTITPPEGAPQRSLMVSWVEPGQSTLAGIVVLGPEVLDVSELLSGLLRRQRQRFAVR
jgi:hypothetical protein